MYTEDTIKKIGDDMELENNDDKFNIEKTFDGIAVKLLWVNEDKENLLPL